MNNDPNVLLKVLLDSSDIGSSDIAKIQKILDKYTVHINAELDKTQLMNSVKNIPYGSGLTGGVRNKRWYQRNRQNILEYQQWCESWGNELFRILKPGAYALIFNSTRTIAQVQVAMENVGFYARDMLVWKRQSGIPKGLNYSKKLEKLGDPTAPKWKEWQNWREKKMKR